MLSRLRFKLCGKVTVGIIFLFGEIQHNCQENRSNSANFTVRRVPLGKDINSNVESCCVNLLRIN